MTQRLQPYINRLIPGDAKSVLSDFPGDSVDFVVTSPPYWTAVTYDRTTPESSGSYPQYIASILDVWKECFRVLRPNGKLAINTPILPIPKKLIGDQHTRHVKNINNDIEFSILNHTGFQRFSLFVWQKQTSKMMFGSYPYPGNILENNTIEFISVYVKPGKPPKYGRDVKEANALRQAEWVDLAQQVWFMYPQDVKRGSDHPAPFPQKLPARLMRMYTFGAHNDFEGDIVLDPFCGTGTACSVAKRMKRRFIGVDISEKYIDLARRRVAQSVAGDTPNLFVGRGKYPNKEELDSLEMDMATGNAGRKAKKKHKRETYGRISSAEEYRLPGFESPEYQLPLGIEDS